jgi:hypothetical protein
MHISQKIQKHNYAYTSMGYYIRNHLTIIMPVLQIDFLTAHPLFLQIDFQKHDKN